MQLAVACASLMLVACVPVSVFLYASLVQLVRRVFRIQRSVVDFLLELSLFHVVSFALYFGLISRLRYLNVWHLFYHLNKQ